MGDFADKRMDDGEGGGVDPLVLQRRAEIRDAYARLLTEHPALPTEIRDFQVQLETCSPLRRRSGPNPSSHVNGIFLHESS